ncbi:MAG: hypothetical protein OXF85_02720 [Candidatus Saccharibacteria bacterium]|nr:hypothetical protein [Candidatus Saccharibacteria bacterium]MCY4010955.1 hypothetical protein [Candidatus Saccharibacteria bacterium]
MAQTKLKKSASKSKIDSNLQVDDLKQQLVQSYQQLRQGTHQNIRLPKILRKKIARTLTQMNQTKHQKQDKTEKGVKNV